MFLQPLIAAGKGLYDRATLPGQVAEIQRKLAIPILQNSEIKTKSRFVFVRSILEASLLEKLEKTNSKEEKLLLKENHFERMRQELKMNKQDLEKQTATRADVAVLGLALQEVALCLDEHVALFKKSGQDEIQGFHNQSQEIVFKQQAFQKQIETQMSEVTQQFQIGLTELRQEGDKVFSECKESRLKIETCLTDFTATIQKQVQDQQQENQRQLEFISQKFQNEFQKLAREQFVLKRNVLIGGILLAMVIVSLFIIFR
jgi:hypothetical protein